MHDGQVEDADTRRFQAQSARLMGDMNDAGDAPFGGEVRLDSKVPVPLPMSFAHPNHADFVLAPRARRMRCCGMRHSLHSDSVYGLRLVHVNWRNEK
jgi:hypothetical protein